MITAKERHFKKPTQQELMRISLLNYTHVARSDFSLGYMYAHYPMQGNFQCHFLNNDMVLLSFNNSIYGKEYAVLTKNDSVEAYRALLDHIRSAQETNVIIGSIDEHDQRLLSRQSFIDQDKLVRDRDNDEYLISCHDHAKYSSSILSTERRAVMNFMSKYCEDIRYYELDLTRHDVSSLLLNAYSSWGKIYRNHNNDLKSTQYRYISQLLFHAADINLKNITICHNDQIIGFGLYEVPPIHKTALFHCLKVDYAFDHAFDFGIHVASNIFLSNNIEYMNIEDDAGIVGIRNKKLNMAPTGFIKKWCYHVTG